jgi:hypothetical protein
MDLGPACAWAALVPSLGFSVLLGLAAGPFFPIAVVYILVFALPIAAAHVLIVWLPAWLLVSRWFRVGAFGAAALGLACGGLPILVIAWAGDWLESADGVALLFGGCGIVGGGAFWVRLNRDKLE